MNQQGNTGSEENEIRAERQVEDEDGIVLSRDALMDKEQRLAERAPLQEQEEAITGQPKLDKTESLTQREDLDGRDGL